MRTGPYGTFTRRLGPAATRWARLERATVAPGASWRPASLRASLTPPVSADSCLWPASRDTEIINFHDNTGYLDADVATASLVRDDDDSRVRVSFHLAKNNPW